MKKILFPALFSSLLFFTSCVITTGKSEKYTTLPTDGKTYDIKSFSAIKADGVFNIILTQGTKESVVVKGDLPQGLTITNSGDTLVINDTIDGSNSHHTIKTNIYVTLVNVKNISIESVGATSCTDTLKLKNLDFHVEGVGATELWLNADTVNASEDGVGKLILAGKVAYAKIDDSGVGALDADDLKVDVLHVNISGVGAAKVYANKEIYLVSSGVGGVQYGGPAKVMQNDCSGIGKVQHED